MCDSDSTIRPCNPAVRRNGPLPINPLPTSTTRKTSDLWITDGNEEFYEPWIVRLPAVTPVLGFRQDGSSGSGSSPAGPTGSDPSSPVSDSSGSDGSGSGSGSPTSPPTSGSTSPPISGSSDSGSQSGGSSSSSSTDLSSSSTSDSVSSISSSTTTSSTTTTTSSTTTSSTSSESSQSTSSTSSSSSASSSSGSPSSSSTSASSASQTSSPSTPTSSSSNAVSDSPSSTTPSPTITNGVTSTITSVIVTDINGTSTTITSLIPTVLSQPSASPMSPATRRAIITGSAIGGSVFIIIIVALVIFCKRSNKIRLNYRKLRVFGHRQRDMLFDEDDDYDLADPPGMHRLSERYTDDPRTPSMHSRASSRTQGVPPFPVASIPGSSSPHLLGLRASESGSIFREAVWPPPGDQSRLVDPLVAGSNAVDLGRIVGDVMGPTGPNMQPGERASQSSLQPSVAIATGVGSGAHSRQSSATRLLSSQYPTTGDPPAYNDADRRDYEAELARAQSPDSVRYTTREGPLRVANAGPDSPSSVTFNNNTPPGTPKVKNWLERSPKTVAKETDDPSRPTDDDHVVMGEAL